MLRAVLVVAAAVGAAMSGVSAPVERPDAPAVSVFAGNSLDTLDRDDSIDRDDFDGGNGGDGLIG
jgi:hypothetical protein